MPLYFEEIYLHNRLKVPQSGPSLLSTGLGYLANPIERYCLKEGINMVTYDFSPLFRSTVGFDRMTRLLDAAMNLPDHSDGYPPYNIQKIDDNTYGISIAVAGFGEDDLEVTAKENTLIVKGKSKDKEKETPQQGISPVHSVPHPVLQSQVEKKHQHTAEPRCHPPSEKQGQQHVRQSKKLTIQLTLSSRKKNITEF